MMTTQIQEFKMPTINKDYIEEHIIACVRPHTEDGISTIPMADMDMYFRCVLHESEQGLASFRITKEIEETFSLDLSVLRACAKDRAEAEVTCRSIGEALGFSASEDDLPLYVLSTRSITDGAGSALLCTNKLKELAHRLGVERLYIIPSSIHEILALPAKVGPRSDIDELIRTVNCMEVKPEEQLGDHAYVFNAEDCSFSW